jgi:hypothetical protein
MSKGSEGRINDFRSYWIRNREAEQRTSNYQLVEKNRTLTVPATKLSAYSQA